jgi:hypothetical protein
MGTFKQLSVGFIDMRARWHWHCETCVAGASKGHLDVLIWATENGCRMSYNVFPAAAENG